MEHTDISISAGENRYILKGITEAGQDYINDNVTDAEDGDAEVDYRWSALEVADSAIEDGLTVTLDGRNYSGLLN